MTRWSGMFLLAGGMVLWAQSPARTYPKVISRIDPPYSEEARRAAVNTTVLLGVTVGADGTPADVRVTRGAGFGLDESAMESVRGWRFEPGTSGGAPVSVQSTIEVNFRLLAPEHDGQTASLVFSVPPGGQRPQLQQGKIPANPLEAGPQHVRVGITVSAEGLPVSVSLLDASPGVWQADVLREVAGWRFEPGSIGGQPWEMKGIFELRTGSELRTEGARPQLVTIANQIPEDPSLPPPVQLLPADHAVFSIYPRTTVCKWEPVPGATGYLLESDYSYNGVWHAEANHMPGFAYRVTGTEFRFDFVGAQPGRWRVWPVNSAGQRGNPSPWREFRYTR